MLIDIRICHIYNLLLLACFLQAYNTMEDDSICIYIEIDIDIDKDRSTYVGRHTYIS